MKILSNKLTAKIFFLLCIFAVQLTAQKFIPRLSRNYGFTVYELRKFDTSDVQQMLSIADSIQHDSHPRVCSYLAEKRMVQVIPKVKKGLLYRTSRREYYEIGDYLSSLYLLKDNEALKYAKIVVDSIFMQRKSDMYRGAEHHILNFIDFTVAYSDPTYYTDLISLLKGKERKSQNDFDVVRGYAIVFPEMKPQIFNDLREFAKDTSSEYRKGVIWIMGNFKDLPEQREFLYTVATTDPLLDIRLMAVDKLGSLDIAPDSFLFDAIKNLILESISQNDTNIFKSAIYQLKDVRSPYVLQILQDLIQLVPDGYYREQLSLLYKYYNPPEILTYYGPDNGYGVAPVLVLLDSLKSYTQQCNQLQFLGNANFVKELTNHLENAEKHLEKKDSLKCAQEVEKFQSKVNKEYKAQRDKEANKSKGARFVTVEGWKFLYYNAQYIIERLITLPAKSQGTLLQQIDELKAEVQHQSAKNNLGGALLTTSLTRLCEQAKRELQKKDSSETAIYIALFQHIVEETWETTEKIQQKRKKFGALYSDDTAYIALYYRAKYIVEALPARSFDLKAQRSQKLSKELEREIETMKKID